ncbi:MAG: RNA polymerase sigma factor [Myxococcaceae bacterium]|nr:MAG: RNA polymerase sigma factor [Myxococcaceae bacterium]
MPAAVSSGGSFGEPEGPPGGSISTLSPEDRDLVDRLRSGDEPTFLALVEKNHRAMVRVAMGYVASEAVAEEVVQEAWIGILQGLDRFEGRCPLRAWMFRILVNCAKLRGGREARSVPFSALESEDEGGERRPIETFRPPDDPRWPGHWAQGPERWADERLADAEALVRIRAEIEKLPPNQRQVITLRDIEDWDSVEVCEALGISEANQRVLLHRARTKVRQSLAGWAAEVAP